MLALQARLLGASEQRATQLGADLTSVQQERDSLCTQLAALREVQLHKVQHLQGQGSNIAVNISKHQRQLRIRME